MEENLLVLLHKAVSLCEAERRERMMRRRERIDSIFSFAQAKSRRFFFQISLSKRRRRERGEFVVFRAKRTEGKQTCLLSN